MDELLIEYLEDLKSVGFAEDERFPDFLFTFISNDFDDNYYQRGLADSKLLKDAKKIRRKYNDFFDYVDALETYREYVALLEEKHGIPIKSIRLGASTGLIDDYVPPKPKLKNTKKNRMIISSDVMPSRQVVDTPDPETVMEYARRAFPKEDGKSLTHGDMMGKVDKKYRKEFKNMSEELAGRNRKRNMYRASSNAEIDFILNYINNANAHNYSTSGYDKGTDRALTEIIEEIQIERTIPEELLEYRSQPHTKYLRNSRVVDRDDEIQVEVMKALYEMGVDVFGAYGKDMSKTAVKMVRSAVGATGPLTKKERKKAKKQAKKEKERLANKRNNDALLEKTLLRNRYSFSTDGNAISMRMSDLIRNDD